MRGFKTAVMVAGALMMSSITSMADHHSGGYNKSYGGDYNKGYGKKSNSYESRKSKYYGDTKKYDGSHKGASGNTMIVDGKRVSVDQFFKEQQKRGN